MEILADILNQQSNDLDTHFQSIHSLFWPCFTQLEILYSNDNNYNAYNVDIISHSIW